MKEYPILFSAPMVRALLDGSKTQTRRALRLQPLDIIPMDGENAGREWVGLMTRDPEPKGAAFRCKFGVPGDRLWVRETWYCDHWEVQKGPYREVPQARELMAYRADGDRPYEAEQPVWRPSIHMPRWASRIVLEVVAVRVERLSDCSEDDARAEGCTYYEPANNLSHGGWSHDGHYVHKTALASFEKLLESINGAGSWAANPWVWVIEFKRLLP